MNVLMDHENEFFIDIDHSYLFGIFWHWQTAAREALGLGFGEA
jgi:hypothetical protein